MLCRYTIDGSDIARLSNRSDVKVYTFQKQEQQNIREDMPQLVITSLFARYTLKYTVCHIIWKGNYNWLKR